MSSDLTGVWLWQDQPGKGAELLKTEKREDKEPKREEDGQGKGGGLTLGS